MSTEKLTDERIAELNREAQDQGISGIAPSLYFARAIEREVLATKEAETMNVEPVAWACLSIQDPELTNSEELAAYWSRKGRVVTPLYATSPAPSVKQGASDLAAAIHYPECWDTTAYPTLSSALAAVYHDFKCSECQSVAAPSASQGEVKVPLTADDVEWVVNDNAELGVKIGGQFFFLYKGDSLVYESGKHGDGTPMMWRPVGKREFGECCYPVKFYKDGAALPHRYTDELVYTPGLSFGKPGDCDWMPMPAAPSVTDGDGK